MEPKEIVKALPGYLNFAIVLLRSPRDALKPHRGSGKVAPTLLGSLAAGIGVSYIIVIAIRPASLADDPSSIVKRINELGIGLLPVVAMVVVSIGSVIFHVLTRAFLWVQDVTQGRPPSKSDAHLGGTIGDTVNAALSFASVFVPVLCLAVLMASLLTEPGRGQSWSVVAFAAGVPSVFAVVYFPWCIAATHPGTTWLQALVACSMTLVFTYLIGAAIV